MNHGALTTIMSRKGLGGGSNKDGFEIFILIILIMILLVLIGIIAYSTIYDNFHNKPLAEEEVQQNFGCNIGNPISIKVNKIETQEIIIGKKVHNNTEKRQFAIILTKGKKYEVLIPKDVSIKEGDSIKILTKRYGNTIHLEYIH